ncbi:MAG: hypothetical protein ACR2RV_27200, partial [Verrucomicrobiales bacterium]
QPAQPLRMSRQDANSDPASDLADLRELTAEMLVYEGPRGMLVGLVLEIVGILERSAGFRIAPGADVTLGGSNAGEGLAISPEQAALCADQPRRTAIFLRGVHAAIVQALASSGEQTKPVHVLYAGSGPFATLATPFMALFPPGEVRFTILDIHAASIESVKSIVGRLQLETSVASYVIGDACQHTIPAGEVPDVIVSETMDAALETEPQVAIMRHLSNQAPDALLVPESVRVDAVLLDTSMEPNRIKPDLEDSIPEGSPGRIPFGPVFTLDAGAIHDWKDLTGDQLPAGSVVVPAAPGPHYEPFLFTTIITYGNHILRTHDCGLNAPRAFPADGDLTPGETASFHYRLGESPGLRYLRGGTGQADPTIQSARGAP